MSDAHSKPSRLRKWPVPLRSKLLSSLVLSAHRHNGGEQRHDTRPWCQRSDGRQVEWHFRDRKLLHDRGTRCLHQPLQAQAHDEVQLLHLDSATGGTFAVSFGGEKTAQISANPKPTNAQLATALEKLGAVGDVEVTSSSSDVYSVTFRSAEGDLPAMRLDTSQLAGSASVTACDEHRDQTIQTKATAGTFTLSFHGQTTGALPHDVDTALTAELTKLADIHAARVSDRACSGAGECSWRITLLSYEGALEALYPEGQLLKCPTVRQTQCITQKAWCAPGTAAGKHGLHFVARLKGPAQVPADVTHISKYSQRHEVTAVDETTDVLTVTSHTFRDGNQVMLQGDRLTVYSS